MAGVAICAAMLLYGLREMTDYMAWNNARWSAARQLVARNVPPEIIDAGFEWVGWHEFESALPVSIAKGKGRDLRAWTTETPDEYRLAFSPLDGYSVIDVVPYAGSPLAPARRLYLLRSPHGKRRTVSP